MSTGEVTFEEFKEYVKFRMGQRTDLESVNSDNLYGIWTNLAYRQLTTRNRFWGLKKSFYFPQLETRATKTTTDGTAYVAAPDDVLHIRSVYDNTNTRKLHKISWNTYMNYTDREDTDKEGEPSEWVRQADSSGTDQIYLYPTPDTSSENIYVYYRKVPAELTGTSTTVIGSEWDDAIIELATYKGYLWLQEYDKAKVCKEEFLEIVSSVIGIYDQEDEDRKDHAHMDEGYNQFGY
jgi:hypothetical protein